MDTEYVLSYTGSEIEERLGMVDGMVKSVNGQMPDENGNVNVEGCSGGMNTTVANLLVTILRNAVYSTDQSANITALANALASNGGGEEPDIPDEPDIPEPITYTITNELVNVTSSNGATSVTDGARYTAILTAADGYEISSVTVLMGGVDVTADVYADGVIAISAVTGNVEIMASAVEIPTKAELITDGLMGYWDFRNPEEVIAKDWHWAYPSNEGNGGMYASFFGGSMGNKELPTFGEYGVKNGSRLMLDATTYPAFVEFGTEFTFIILSYGLLADVQGQTGVNGVKTSNIGPRWAFVGSYYKTDGTKTLTDVAGYGNGDSLADYNILVKRVNGSDMKVVMDTSECIFKGENYEDFSYWDKRAVPDVNGNTDGSVVACAIYDRALSDVEIVELCEYFKTLEVA